MKKSKLKQIIKEEIHKVFSEIKIKNPRKFSDDRKALGILFYENPNKEEIEDFPYLWNEEMVKEFVKDLGYKDYEDVAGEIIHYNSPGDEEQINIVRQASNNPNLKISDITLGNYKDVILNNFELY